MALLVARLPRKRHDVAEQDPSPGRLAEQRGAAARAPPRDRRGRRSARPARRSGARACPDPDRLQLSSASSAKLEIVAAAQFGGVRRTGDRRSCAARASLRISSIARARPRAPRWLARGSCAASAASAIGEQRVHAVADRDRVEHGLEQFGIAERPRARFGAPHQSWCFRVPSWQRLPKAGLRRGGRPSAVAKRAPRSSTVVPAPPNFCPAKIDQASRRKRPAGARLARKLRASSNSCAYSSRIAVALPYGAGQRATPPDRARRTEGLESAAHRAQARRCRVRAPSGPSIFGSSNETAFSRSAIRTAASRGRRCWHAEPASARRASESEVHRLRLSGRTESARSSTSTRCRLPSSLGPANSAARRSQAARASGALCLSATRSMARTTSACGLASARPSAP